MGRLALLAILAACAASAPSAARQAAATQFAPSASPGVETTRDLNREIARLAQGMPAPEPGSFAGDYRIGSEDLLQVSVLEAPDLDRTVRVSADGQISLALLGSVPAAGLTARQLELSLETLLRRTYMKDPHVGVFVQEMRSHAVSVFGAVQKPGVFQIREPKTLIEVLSMAQGLASDAGDSVIVMHHRAWLGPATAAGPPPLAPVPPARSSSVKVSLKDLLASGDPRYDVLVYPGDVVKVNRAGIVYVVGEVHKPGGFLLKTNENISVLQALALAEGLTPTAEGKHSRIILAASALASRREVAINLDRILAGRAPDRLLEPNDILFVPNSTRKSAIQGIAKTTENIASSVSGAAVYRW